MTEIREPLRAALERLRSRSLLRKVVENAGWQMTPKLLRVATGVLVGVWVARYLGPKGYGSLNFAVAFTALFFPFAELGLPSIVVRDLVRHPERRATIVSSAIALRLAGTGVSICLIICCSLLLRPRDVHSLAMAVAVALSFIPQAWDIVDYDYQARMRPAPITITRAASLVVFSAVKVILILVRAPVICFALAISGEAALCALVFRHLARGLRLAAAARRQMLDLLSSSWPLAISALSVILYMQIDQVMLGQMAGDRAVGIFSAAVRISQSWFFVPIAVVAAAAPALTTAHQASEQDYQRQLHTVMRSLFWMGVAAAVLLSVLSRQIVGYLYGVRYHEAGTVLAIHAWAGMFATLGLSSGPWFVNAGLLRLRMINTAVGAMVNCSLNLYAIPRFGVVGAAVSTLVSYAVAGFLMNALDRRSWPLFSMQIRSLTFR
jgi:PST family polysaccharide transporter